jgi:hypothetical protein
MPIALVAALGTVHPAFAQYQCHAGHYDVVVPGYVGLPASVDVACGGSITTMDVQWPFNDPSPEAWHNHYELNAADLSVSITVGEVWLCTLEWIANDGGTTRYLIAGCPEMYGGTGQPVPWSDPCIQKVRNRIYPDFWIFKNVIAQNGSTGLKIMSRMLMGFSEGPAPGGGAESEPQPPMGPAGSEPRFPDMAPDLDDPAEAGEAAPPGAVVARPRTSKPLTSSELDVPPPHPFELPSNDVFRRLGRRLPGRP